MPSAFVLCRFSVVFCLWVTSLHASHVPDIHLARASRSSFSWIDSSPAGDSSVRNKSDVVPVSSSISSDAAEESESRSPSEELEDGPNVTKTTEHHEDHSIHVASWQWEYVRTPFVYTAVVIVAGLCKIGFHHAGFLSSIIPESCVLIMLGTVVGTIVHFQESRDLLPQFTPKAFFLFLLPPIVLESAYSLHDRAFFRNLGTILVYAVLGTLINCFSIGAALFGLAQLGALSPIRLDLVQCLVFSSLISAVDPVAVLAIFQEVGVNKDLYFLVFGESLLNDAVTIVLYMMMVGFSKAESITAQQVGMGVAAFLCVSCGGLAIGILMGVLTALVTKHTKDVRVVEPLAMLGIAYLSYLAAEMVHFSGIISIIGCGIVQAHYASRNISQKSNTTVKYFTKMVSAVCDTVIFLFLGMVLVDDTHIWHTGFVLWATGLCLIFRFMGVFLLTFCANKLERTRNINAEEQFIMAYGGLRGAVAFSLVIMLEEGDNKSLFTTATLFIVLFTVFVQGATIKPLVIFLKIRRQAAKTTSSLFTEVNKKVLDHVMAGVEEVTGDRGGNYWKQILQYYNNKYLKKWLQCNYGENNLTRVYTRMMLEDHFAHLYGPATVIEDHKPLLLNRRAAEEEPEEVLEVLSPVHEEDDQEDLNAPQMIFGDQEQETAPLRAKRTAAKHLRLTLPEQSKYPADGASNRPPLLKRQTTLSMFKRNEDEDTSKLLQKALHDNPYNKLYHKYNPNLVDDDDQDLKYHLKARRIRAKRLTLLAMHSILPNAPVPQDSSTGNVSSPIPPSSAPAVTKAACFFLERAQRRKNLKEEHGLQRAATVSSAPLSFAKCQRLERQKAVSDIRDSTDINSAAVEKKLETNANADTQHEAAQKSNEYERATETNV